MVTLTKVEEMIMQILWDFERGFILWPFRRPWRS